MPMSVDDNFSISSSVVYLFSLRCVSRPNPSTVSLEDKVRRLIERRELLQLQQLCENHEIEVRSRASVRANKLAARAHARLRRAVRAVAVDVEQCASDAALHRAIAHLPTQLRIVRRRAVPVVARARVTAQIACDGERSDRARLLWKRVPEQAQKAGSDLVNAWCGVRARVQLLARCRERGALVCLTAFVSFCFALFRSRLRRARVQGGCGRVARQQARDCSAVAQVSHVVAPGAAAGGTSHWCVSC